MEKLVSIIVPIYQIEDYLPECIDSIINQTYKNIEIILVNDGSKDHCPSICDAYAKKDTRIRVIHQKNQGLINARKRGFNVAKGFYVTFIDGDDWVLETHIEHLAKNIQKADICITSFQKDFLGTKSRIRNFFKDGLYVDADLQKTIFPQAISTIDFFSHGISTYYWNKLFKRDKLAPHLKSAKSDVVMGEDSCVVYPYLFNCNSVQIISSYSYIYRQRQDSIIKNPKNSIDEFISLSSMFLSLKQGLKSFGDNFDLKRQLLDYFLFSTFTRSGGIIETKESIIKSPHFEGLTKVLLVSSGSFGQILFSKLNSCFPNIVTAWVDDDHEESVRSGLEVISIKNIKNIEFNEIIIASFDQNYIDKITKEIGKINPSYDYKYIAFTRDSLMPFLSILKKMGFNIDTFEFLENV